MKHKLMEDKEFLKYYKKSIREGYQPLLNIDEIYELINKIYVWYTIKYPINYIFFDNNEENVVSQSNDVISNLNFEALIKRLSLEEQQTFKCEYTSKGGVSDLFFSIKNKNYKEGDYRRNIIIHFDPKSGIIDEDCFSQFYTSKYKREGLKIESIDELYQDFKSEKDINIDYSELERIIKDKEIDEKIRSYIIKLINEKLKNNDNSEISAYRVVKFRLDVKEYIESQTKNVEFQNNQEKQLTKKK